MNCTAIAPFDRIEAAQEYLALLNESVADNRKRIEAEIMEATNQNSARFSEVLKLGVYNLEKLEKHLRASQLALNNLRKLRRLLLRESNAKRNDQQKLAKSSA